MIIIETSHITFITKDIEKSFSFYRDVLNLKFIAKWDKGACFLVGDHWLYLRIEASQELNQNHTYYVFTFSKTDFSTISEKLLKLDLKTFKASINNEGALLCVLDPDKRKILIRPSDSPSQIASIEVKKSNIKLDENIASFDLL